MSASEICHLGGGFRGSGGGLDGAGWGVGGGGREGGEGGLNMDLAAEGGRWSQLLQVLRRLCESGKTASLVSGLLNTPPFV